MADITTGTLVRPLDRPPAASAADSTQLLNVTNTTYEAGDPEVGVVFVAPTSGRVVLTVGGGARDNTNDNRVFFAPQVFEGVDSSGEQVLAPNATNHGLGTVGTAAEIMYASRSSLLEDLTPGQVYYARVMHFASVTTGATADINSRDITVVPTT